MLPDFEPGDSEQAHQRLATLLLARAVHITYAVDQMKKFATGNSTSDSSAATDMADAIDIMTTVRTTLINHADHLSQPSPPSRPHHPIDIANSA